MGREKTRRIVEVAGTFVAPAGGLTSINRGLEFQAYSTIPTRMSNTHAIKAVTALAFIMKIIILSNTVPGLEL